MKPTRMVGTLPSNKTLSKASKWMILAGSLLSLIASAALAEPVAGTIKQPTSLLQNYTVRPDTRVVLKVPYETILYGEIPHIYLGVKNDSETPLKLMDLNLDSYQQLVFEARATVSGPNLTNPKFIPDWDILTGKKLPEQAWENSTDQRKKYLNEVEANGSRIFNNLGYNYDILPKTTSEFRVGLLTGRNEWIFSEWVKLRRLNDQPLESANIAGTIDHWTRESTIRKATIDRASYLFLNKRRIARIPEGATPRFEWDKKNGLLTVHFDGVKVPPLVHFVRMIETKEWTPETAPHAEALKNLKAELMKPASGTNASKPSVNLGSKSSGIK